MDRLLKRFDTERDKDLAVSQARGFAYQREMRTVDYGVDYYAKVEAYENSPVAIKVNAGRHQLVARHLQPGASILDWGCGTGAFMRVVEAGGFKVSGYDANPVAQLKLGDKLAQDPYQFDALTMWDTIEHLEQPELVLKNVKRGSLFFASLPIFEDIRKVRESKHYRPNEHLYYWTAEGFCKYMELYGFRFVERSFHETEAGRESIGAFVFKRDLPDYHDNVAAYKEIHSTKHYGNSATEEYLNVVAEVVRERQPRSILDYGCGRSDLAAHFWNDGRRRLARYDPAIGAYKRLPEGRYDMVFCCDVLEHVRMADVDQVFAEIHSKGNVVLFTISTILARAKLPDGRNAHITLLSKAEWERWIKDTFSTVRVLKAKHEHELVVLAGA